MKLIHNQIADSIGSIQHSINKQIQSKVSNRVLTFVRICINTEDLQKWGQRFDFDYLCILLRNATKEQIRDQFSVRLVEG
jgi:hypothetical protein